MVKVLVASLLTGMLLWPRMSAQAQTIISESGRLIYFNSLDSARAASISRLAALVACWLDNFDPRDSFPVLLDLRPGPVDRSPDDSPTGFGRPDSPTHDSSIHNSTTTSFGMPDSSTHDSPTYGSPTHGSPTPRSACPQLGYDNLFGNSLSYTDSSSAPTDPGQQLYFSRLGLRIRIADSLPDPKTLLQLLEWGIAHFAALRQIRTLCLSDRFGQNAANPLAPNSSSDPASGSVTLVPRDIARILARPLSPKLRLALKSCY